MTGPGGQRAAAVSRSWAQSPTRSSAVVAVAPTETRRSCTPFTTAGVRYARPDALTARASARLCASSAEPSSPGGRWRKETVWRGTGARRSQPGVAST